FPDERDRVDRNGLREFLSGEIVALGQPDLSPAARAALAAAGFDLIEEYDLDAIGATVLRYSTPLGLGEIQALEEARALVPGAVFDLHDLFGGSGVGCAECWGADLVRLASLPVDACTRGAPIAVLDTEVDTAHPALRGASVVQRRFLPPGARPLADGHGTAVAALLVGESAPGALPLAPGNALLAASVFRDIDGQGRADAVGILRALNWALSSGARVVAMSFEGAGNLAVRQAVRGAHGRASLVAAAGNGGRDAPPAYPAAFAGVIAVSAVDARGRAYRGGTRGGYVELAAPGVDVVSAAPDGGWQRWSGSSFAVPFVAAALLRARAQTGDDPEAARTLLTERAADLGARGRDEIYGHGLLQVDGRRCW
ncbi:MAG: S8 family serine peptidase, partial [Pseudomonadota bacterium]